MKKIYFTVPLRIMIFSISCAMVYWYVISKIINIGSVMGTLFFGLIGVCCIFWDKLSDIIKKIKQKRALRIIYKIVCVMIALLMIWVCVILGLMSYFAKRTPDKDATVVVLGCQVLGNNNPSLMLRKRIDAAFDYLVMNPQAKCVVSGGKGNGENISEAECIRNELIDKGIDENRIYMEDQSTDTSENIKFSAEIIKKNGLNEKMAIVTDGFHEMRAALIAKRMGYECGAVSAKTPTYISANFTTREIIAVTAALLLNR